MSGHYHNEDGTVYYNNKKVEWATKVLSAVPEDAVEVVPYIYIDKQTRCYYKQNKNLVLELYKHTYSFKNRSTTCYVYNKNTRSYLRVHLLYAKAFIPNPFNYLRVFAKDKDYTNISCDNLYWANANWVPGYKKPGGIRLKSLPTGYVHIDETPLYINKEAEVYMYDEQTKEFISINIICKNSIPRIAVSSYREKLYILYAKAFVPNPYNYKFVRAKDGNYTNISCDNLEWVPNNNIVTDCKRNITRLPDGYVNVPNTNVYINKNVEVYSNRGAYYVKENPFPVTRGNSTYYAISYCDPIKKAVSYRLHILYALAFIKKQNTEQDFVAAYNGDVTDISMENLYWTTNSEYRSKLNRGKKVPTYDKMKKKLAEIDMELVHNEYHRNTFENLKNGMTGREIADERGVSVQTINYIINFWYKRTLSKKSNTINGISDSYYIHENKVYSVYSGRRVKSVSRVTTDLPKGAVEVCDNIYIAKDSSCYYKEDNCFFEMKKTPDGKGKYYSIYDKFTGKRMLVHTLYAKAFLPNPSKAKTVRIKDGNRDNINCENLLWVKK